MSAAKATSSISEEKDIGALDVLPTILSKDLPNQTDLQNAIAAEHSERDMGFWTAIKTYKTAVFWSMALSATLIMEGYDTSLLGNAMALPTFRQHYGHYLDAKNGYQLDPAWQAAVQNAPTIGAVIGIIIAGWAQDRFGYRRTLQFSLAWITAAIFVVFFAPNIYVLFVGELLCGLPWGAFSASAVAYASDITPIALRGYLTIFVSMCWIIGQFIAGGLLVGIANMPGDIVFKLPFGLQWVWPVPLFILVTLAPESPWWLVRKNRLDDAHRVIRRLAARNSSVNPAHTVAMMQRTTAIEAESSIGGNYAGCFKGVNLRRTEIACIGWAVTIWSGSSFANHPSYFFVQAGMTAKQAISMDLGIRGVAFVATGLSWVNLSYLGRRTMFVGGLFGLFCVLVLAAILGTLTANGYPNAMWAEAAMCVIWVLIWDSMVTTCAYAIVGESSSTRLRAKTTGLARNVYNCSGLVGGSLNTYFMNPAAWNVKGMSAWFWAGTCFLAFVWAYFRLPEMKGRSFRELDILFERGVPARQFSKTVIGDDEEH